MENNLDIGLNEFKKMKSNDRDILIYNNLVSIRKKMGDYNFNKKIQYTWLSILTVVIGLKKFIGL
ncbi:MAG TPA: hypothetical protein ENI61_05345 [Ignavibacteria bacterium]|nr:hypothetical protein [Ignavibacteria bacterium]